jgi:beta-N-acetylhexosaminidase
MNEVAALAREIILTGFDTLSAARPSEGFAGYVLFARNGTSVADMRACTDELRSACSGALTPLIAIDQEGGRVARLREGVEDIPSMMALGATQDIELVERAGEQVAFDLRRAGCTLDFAPVIDLALDPSNTVIGTRSFGSDPGAVAAMGAAFARGLERGGTLACFKHFPGHGSAQGDSHLVLPAVDADAATLRGRDFAPFAAVAPHARAIMGAHVVVPVFDAALPATMSPALIRVLRDDFGFSGAYVTDCLYMAAVADGADGTAGAALAALRGGADLLLVSHSADLAVEIAARIAEAVASGDVPLERLREAHVRVTQLRAASSGPLSLDAFAPHPGVGREIARHAVTLVRGIAHADPVATVVVSFESATEEGAQGAHVLHPSLRREAPILRELTLPADPSDAETDAMLAAMAQGSRRPLVLMRRAHIYPAQARAVARILDVDPDAVVVSVREPYDVALFGQARHVLATYGDDASSIGGLADVIFGGLQPMGQLPVELAIGV